MQTRQDRAWVATRKGLFEYRRGASGWHLPFGWGRAPSSEVAHWAMFGYAMFVASLSVSLLILTNRPW